jgi:hypothetical protein
VTIPLSADHRATVDSILVKILKGLHKRTSNDIVINFSSALDVADAQDLAAYHLVAVGKLNKKAGQRATRPVKLTSATYSAATDTVTLAIKGKRPNQPLQLSINTSAVLDASGQPIAGSSGQSGGPFQATFGKKGINLTSVSAKAFDAPAAMGSDSPRAGLDPIAGRALARLSGKAIWTHAGPRRPRRIS